MIKKLYEASGAGVKVNIIIRGICCLVPGIPGLSENIKVTSIVGRYLEHSRVFYFYNKGKEEIYLSSADMMQRNLDRRVEITFPIEDSKLKTEIMRSILKISLKDNIKSRILLPDMTYKIHDNVDGAKKINSQEWMMKHSIKAGGEAIEHS